MGPPQLELGRGVLWLWELAVPWWLRDAHGGGLPLPWGGLQGFKSPYFKEGGFFPLRNKIHE